MSENEVEIGMTVRIKTLKEVCDFYHTDENGLFGSVRDQISIVGGMREFFGTEGIINDYDQYGVYIDDNFWWPFDTIEPIEEDSTADIQVSEWEAIALAFERR